MVRLAAAVLAGAVPLAVGASAGLAADMARQPAIARQPGQANAGGRVPGPTRPPLYSYYGEYQYPVPFGYGYSYAPTRSHGFEYGYYGPRYSWSDPDWYSGPAFSYPEW